jgi:hypothetical protein
VTWTRRVESTLTQLPANFFSPSCAHTVSVQDVSKDLDIVLKENVQLKQVRRKASGYDARCTAL